jgi:hypothetical protein
MTGAQTEPVRTPAYLTAVALLLRLSGPLFKRWAASEAEENEQAFYDAWATLRRTAEWFLAKSSMLLSSLDNVALLDAFKAAHDSYHTGARILGEVAPSSDHCPCHVAQTIRELKTVLALGAIHAG